MEPVALIGENISVLVEGGEKHFEVMYLEGIPETQIVDAAPVAGIVAGGTNVAAITNMGMRDLEIGQWRLYPIDDIICQIWAPQAMGRYITRAVMATLDIRAAVTDPCGHLSELFVYQNMFPFVTALNPMAAAITMARLRAHGFRYVVQELKSKPARSVHVVAQGWGFLREHTARR